MSVTFCRCWYCYIVFCRYLLLCILYCTTVFSEMTTNENKYTICKVCYQTFSSRNSLFVHLSSNDHSSPLLPSEQAEQDVVVVSSAKTLEERIFTAAEDDYYRVIVKPQGFATMGAKGLSKIGFILETNNTHFKKGPTLLSSDALLLPNAISRQLRYKKAVPCHRLDSSTGGLVICSKSKDAEVNIMKCFRNKWIKKMYIAIVAGSLEPANGAIDVNIGEKNALTQYSVVKYSRSAKYGWLSTVQLWPITGRKHQLRRHLAAVNHPIIGDRRYW